ncbi:uncharacterized protein LOC115736099 [Rhodamnia argentea]|uniref:Uncharacterized protein LOC115736099 n=1 Tax=Rhodamnia argentea TaxID=178133 RepID=A0A8B8NND9_9MYRT|nr:uncharacterized protein LOC115736099 [Rhodamnia argentea]
MESTSLCSSSPFLPLNFTTRQSHRPRFSPFASRGRKHDAVVLAARRDSNEGGCSGRLADEGMIILRKRIHEMKMIERNYEPPKDWMEWEKKYYTCYDEYVCKFVGVLQSRLMSTRPSVAVGMLAFMMMSIPVSTAVILSRAVEVAIRAWSAVSLN